MISFIYNNKIYTTNNLDKKLIKMGITKDLIVIPSLEKLIPDIDTSIKTYKWYNTKTKHTLTSVEENFPTGLEKYLGDKNDWIKIN